MGNKNSCHDNSAKLMTQLFLWRDRALYIGPSIDYEAHEHHAVQICAGLKGTFRIHSEHWEQPREVRAALIASDTPHQIETLGHACVFAYLDPEATSLVGQGYGAPPDAHARIQTWDTFECNAIMPAVDTTPPSLDAPLSIDAAKCIMDALLQGMGLTPTANVLLDKRIQKILLFLHNHTEENSTSEELQQIAHLSASRLQHLFKQQVGLPLRRYRLWLRIRRVIEQALTYHNLTEAAVSAGFTDSAHFSRIFKEMLGVPPSAILASGAKVHITLGDTLF